LIGDQEFSNEVAARLIDRVGDCGERPTVAEEDSLPARALLGCAAVAPSGQTPQISLECDFAEFIDRPGRTGER
jgi:hypothetical protein